MTKVIISELVRCVLCNYSINFHQFYPFMMIRGPIASMRGGHKHIDKDIDQPVTARGGSFPETEAKYILLLTLLLFILHNI